MQEMIALYRLDMVWQQKQKEEPKKSPGHTRRRVNISQGSIIAVCGKFQYTSPLANSLHGMEDYAHHQCVVISVH